MKEGLTGFYQDSSPPAVGCQGKTSQTFNNQQLISAATHVIRNDTLFYDYL
jgi:hypothetical protein